MSVPFGGAASAPSAGAGIGVVSAYLALRSGWRLLVIVPLVCVAIAAVVAFTMSPTYKATTIFVPEAGQQGRLPSAIAGVAGQFGISLGDDGSRSPQFYATVATTRDLLRRVLLTRYPDARPGAARGDSATLLEQMELEGDSAARTERALNLLTNALRTEVDLPTGMVKLSYTSESPQLAAAVANRVVQVIEDFNATTRRSQARQRQVFVAGRRAEVQEALRRAENELDAFHARNRAWDTSPALRTAEARLRRQVDLQQEVFLTLSREYETSRIEAVNDAPVISVIERATPPRYKAAPRRALILIMGAVFGVLLALCIVAARAALAQWRALTRHERRAQHAMHEPAPADASRRRTADRDVVDSPV